MTKRTNKKITFEFLDGCYIMSNNQINDAYLCYMVDVYLNNTKPLYDSIKNTRRSPENVAHQAALYALNAEMAFSEYSNYHITSAQLISWLNNHGLTWEVFRPIADSVIETRKELLEG